MRKCVRERERVRASEERGVGGRKENNTGTNDVSLLTQQ